MMRTAQGAEKRAILAWQTTTQEGTAPRRGPHTRIVTDVDPSAKLKTQSSAHIAMSRQQRDARKYGPAPQHFKQIKETRA